MNGVPWSHAGSLLGHNCALSPHLMAQPSPCLSPQAALMPPGPGQRHQNGQQLRTGSSDIPLPRATGGREFSRQKLQAPLLTGLGLQPTPAWAESTAPASLALQGARAALSGSPWRSPWRDFGSEKLWMREGQGPSPVPKGLRAARVHGCGN